MQQKRQPKQSRCLYRSDRSGRGWSSSSLERPGGNLTGLSILAPELNGKRLELLKDAFPNVTRIAFLTRTGGRENRFNEAEFAAKGLRLQFFAAKGADDLDRTFDAAKSAGVQAFISRQLPF